MVETNVVAIVEKVYRSNTEANMMALFPSVDVPNEPWVNSFLGFTYIFLSDLSDNLYKHLSGDRV